MRWIPRLGALGGAVLGVGLLGCVSTTPFAEVQRRVGPERFLTVGGHAVHVEQNGQGPPVVLLHGFGGSTLSWQRVAPGLAAYFRVVAVDQFGFGWTERPTGSESYGTAAQIALVIGVMDALGIERAAVVGHSWGGGLALRLAALHPERVSSLVLVSSTAPGGPARRRSGFARRWLGRAALRTVVLRQGMVRRHLQRSVHDPGVISDEMVTGYLARLRVEGAGRALDGLSRPPMPPLPALELGNLAVPVLLVWGSEDRIVPPVVGERLESSMPGARRVVLDRCGHLPMEEAPERFLDAVLPFLAGTSGVDASGPAPGSDRGCGIESAAGTAGKGSSPAGVGR